jgi:excisionase family DNA binding protein
LPRVLCGLEVAAERLDVNSRTIRRFIRDGLLPAYRVGRLLKVAVADVDALARPVDPHEVSG